MKHDFDDNTLPDDAEEISKTDLLRETGISYGQFYRWKRAGLIPDSWFHRRSTFTGQGVFLPRRQVLERIARIQELKDQYSLEEIAGMLSPDIVERRYDREEVARLGGLNPRAWAFLRSGKPELRFFDLLCLFTVDRLLRGGQLPDAQLDTAVSLLQRFSELEESAGGRYLAAVRQGHEILLLLYSGACLFGDGAVVLETVPLDRLVEEIKLQIRDL